MSANVVVDQFENVWRELRRLQQAVDALRTQDEPSVLLPFVPWTALPGTGYAATTGDIYLAAVAKKLVLLKCVMTAWVWTTNDSSNYWNLRLVLPGPTTVITLTTQGAAPSAWNQYSGTTFSPATIDASNRYVSVFVDKVGAPGNLGIVAPSLFVK